MWSAVPRNWLDGPKNETNQYVCDYLGVSCIRNYCCMSTTFYVWLTVDKCIVYPKLLQPTTCIRNPNLNATLLALPRSNRTSCHPGVCSGCLFRLPDHQIRLVLPKFGLSRGGCGCHPILAFNQPKKAAESQMQGRIEWLARLPSTGIRSVNPTVRLTRPKIEAESAYLDSA